MGLSLTEGAKLQELMRWQELKDGPRGKGGTGFPDDRIIPLCTEINVFPGVCTLQSCAGHPRTPEQKWAAPGQLWLWLDDPTFNAFIRAAPAFARRPGIEEVRLLFGRYNDERVVADIMFDGDDKGALDASAAMILSFLGELSVACGYDVDDRRKRFLPEYEALCRKHRLFVSTFPESLDLCDFSKETGDRDLLETLTELGS